MKKKLVMFIVSTALVCTTFGGSIFAQNNMKVKQITIQTKVVKGIEIVPLREVSENLGFSVTWDAENKMIYLDDGIMNTRLTLGMDSYYASSSQAIGMSAPQALGMGPVLIDAKVYVPAKMFFALLGNADKAVVIENGTATFTKGVEA